MGWGVVSGLGSIMGSYMQSQAQAQAAQAQAQANYYNAAVAQQNAIAVQQAAMAEKLDQDRKNRSMLESVRSNYLNSGIELEGTPLLVLSEQASSMALDSERILHKGKVQSANYLNQASMNTFQGDQALIAGTTQSNTTLLGGTVSGLGQIGRSIYSAKD